MSRRRRVASTLAMIGAVGVAAGVTGAIACQGGSGEAADGGGEGGSTGDGGSSGDVAVETGGDAGACGASTWGSFDQEMQRTIGASGHSIAPAIGGGSVQPKIGAWTDIGTQGILTAIFARIGITSPCDTDPESLQGADGFLEYIAVDQSLVLNSGGTRSTFGYYVKSSASDIDTQYLALFSYDRIVPEGGAPICATEFFLFGPFQILDCGKVDPLDDPPELFEGLAIDKNGCLLKEVPLTLARVKNYGGPYSDGKSHKDPTESVKPGVGLGTFFDAGGCLLCHSRGPGDPQSTRPFPWMLEDGGNDGCAPPPTLTTFAPSSGMPGTQVTITGLSLGGPAAVVTFTDAAGNQTMKAAVDPKSTDTTLVVTVPPTARSGAIAVQSGGATLTSANAFDVGGVFNVTATKTGCISDAGTFLCLFSLASPLRFSMKPSPADFTIGFNNGVGYGNAAGTYNADGSYTATGGAPSGAADNLTYTFTGTIQTNGAGSGNMTELDTYSIWSGTTTGTYTTDACIGIGMPCPSPAQCCGGSLCVPQDGGVVCQ